MRCPTNIQEVEAVGVDYMGFIFHPSSPRFIDTPPSYLPSKCKRVGVFVNPTLKEVKRRAKQFQLDLIQLHGDETIELCQEVKELGLELIKAFHPKTTTDFLALSPYLPVVDYLLFDHSTTAQPGGTGVSFNWELLNHYQDNTPFLLSGGIDSNAVPSIHEITHPSFAGVDINSRFETEPGIKSANQIRTFKKHLNYESNK